MTIYLKLAVYVAVFSSLLISVDAFAQGLKGLASGNVVTEATPEQGDESSYQAPDNSYAFGINDDVKITVYGEDDLSNTYNTGSAGVISFPLIGDIQVRGMTAHQVTGMIESKLADGYLKKPSVFIEVASHREFYILGEVRTPGSYDYEGGVTVLKAVELAGGFTYRANKKHVQVLKARKDDPDLYEKMPMGAAIESGDIILVKERYF